MDDENRSAMKGEVADILQKKEDLMALFKDNESKLEDRVSALEDLRVRRTHRPPKHKSAVKDPAQRADALFEQAVKRSRGMAEAAAEEGPKPQAPEAPGVQDFDLSALTQAKEKLAREIAEEETGSAVEAQAPAAEETETPLHPDAVAGREDLNAIPDLTWDITPHEPDESEEEAVETAAAEEPAAEAAAPVLEPAAEEAAPVAEETAAQPEPEMPEAAESQAAESLFDEEPMAEEAPLFDEEPLFEETPVSESAKAESPAASDLFFKEETLEEAGPEAAEPQAAESLFDEEPMAEEAPLFDEEPLFEETPVTESPKAESPAASDLFFKEETLEEAAPEAAEPQAAESLFDEEPMTEEGPLFDEEPLFEEAPVTESPAEEIPTAEKQRAAMDEFFRMSGEEEEIPSIFNKAATQAEAPQAAAEEAAVQEAGDLWEEEPLTEAAPDESPSLFEEEVLSEGPAEEPAADSLFEEEVLTEDSAQPAAAGDLWGDIPAVQASAADALFEEETLDAAAPAQAAAPAEDGLFDVEELAEETAAPADDLFETETIQEDAAAPADDLFETETMTDGSDLFETLDIPVEAGVASKAASPDQATEEGKHRLGESQRPTVGPSGEAGQTMGMEAAATKADAVGYPKAVFVLSAVFTGIALAALIVYAVIFRGSFNRVDVLTFVIMGIFMILSFDMKPVATVLVSAGLMAGYFLMEIYWAGSQSLTLGLSNMLMEGLIPLVLIPCSFFVTGLMARKSAGRPKQIEAKE